MKKRCGIKKLALGCAAGALIAGALGIVHRTLSAESPGAEPITVRDAQPNIEQTTPVGRPSSMSSMGTAIG